MSLHHDLVWQELEQHHDFVEYGLDIFAEDGLTHVVEYGCLNTYDESACRSLERDVPVKAFVGE